MKTRIDGFRKGLLISLLAGGFVSGVMAQCQFGERVWSPVSAGNFYLASQGTNSPPLPSLPQSVTNVTDTDNDPSHPPSLYSTGAVSLDVYDATMSVTNVIVTP